MRAIRTAVKGLAPLAAVVAVMAVPAVAAASPAEWTEYDGTPIDTVTADISGNVNITVQTANPITANCQVTGEIELSNDGPGGTATQKIVSMQVDDVVPGPAVCGGAWLYSYPPTQVTYSTSTPWSGPTIIDEYWGYKSTFDNFHATTTWGGSGGLQLTTTGSIPTVAYEVEVGSDYCIGIFETWDGADTQTGAWNSKVDASLELDLGTLEGLSTEEGGPCVKLAEA